MPMVYFAYGSNMSKQRLEDRVGLVTDAGVGVLQSYSIEFNKKGKDGSGKTNIVKSNGSKVYGVLYKLSSEQVEILNGFEPNYERRELDIILDTDTVKAETYQALPESIDPSALPSEEYLNHLIHGAQEHDLPEDYINFLRTFQTQKLGQEPVLPSRASGSG